MIICGIDASTKCSGIATISSSGEILSHTYIDLHNIKDTEERIDKMILAIEDHFLMHKPDICYVENTWNARNIETTKKLTNIIGAIRHMCLQNNCSFNLILPSSWRSIIGIDGGQNTKREEFKKRAMQYAKDQYNFDCEEDEAEAIGICTAAYIKECNKSEDLSALFE